MVQLLILSPTGNAGSRYFPHSGHFGLTPCIVNGIVRVKHDEDARPFPAKSLTIAVRCYESRLGRINTLYTNILANHSLTLWSKPDHLPAVDIGEVEYPFKITIPLDSPGFSTASFQEYKVSWRIEAVLEHLPITGVGSRLIKHYDLPLIRYDNAVNNSAARPSVGSAAIHSAKFRTVFRYNLSTPSSPIGPEDLVSNYVCFHPLDPLVVVRSASLTIERRLHLHNSSSSQTSSRNPLFSDLTFEHQQSSHIDSHSSTTRLLSPSSSSSSISVATITGASNTSALSISDAGSDLTIRPLLSPHTPILPSSPVVEPSKVIANTIVSTEVSDFSRDSSGMWTKHITVQWPSRKRHAWATGETLTSEMATIRFYIRVRLHVSSPTTSTEAIELDERELMVVSTNDSERRLALAQFNDYRASTLRSKSRSPGRRIRGEDPEQSSAPQISASLPPRHTHKPSTDGTTGKIRPRTSRRPHTSAGPRDRSNQFYSAQPEVSQKSTSTVKVHMVPSAAKYTATPELVFHRETARSRKSEDYSKQGQNRHQVPLDSIRDWEAELARIESESRRSSADMLGSWGGHKRQKMRANPP